METLGGGIFENSSKERFRAAFNDCIVICEYLLLFLSQDFCIIVYFKYFLTV